MSGINIANKRWTTDRLLEVRRDEVLTQRSTDLGPIEKTVERHASLPEAKRADLVMTRGRAEGRTIVQPRHGETLIDGQIGAMQALAAGGADITSVLTDAYTRQLQFADADRALIESEELGRSLICGYPVTSKGVEATKRIVDNVPCPCSVRMASSDARLSKEIYLAAGFTYMFMGPIQNLAYEKLATPERLITNYQYEDRLIGFLTENGAPVVKELPATLTGTLVPPEIALAATLIDTLLAVEQGVRHVVCNYGLLGNLIQDVAAIRVLRELSNDIVHQAADGVQVYVATPQWMGDFPQDEGEAYGVVLNCSIAAALGGADEIVTKSLDEAFGVPTTEANVAGVRATRRIADILRPQPLEVAGDLEIEIDMLRRSVRAILRTVLDLGKGDLARGTAAAIRSGVIDVPFSPNVYNRGASISARDNAGRVRWLNPGNVPLPRDVVDFHARAIAARTAKTGRHGYYLTVDDVFGFSKGIAAARRPEPWSASPAREPEPLAR